MDIEKLEKSLVSDPFNEDLRLKYASCLFSNNDYQKSLDQYLLITKSRESAEILIAIARCHLLLNEHEQALEYYIRSKAFEDFQPQDDLESLTKNAQPTNHLQVVDENTIDNIVEFAHPTTKKISFLDVAGMDDLKKTLRIQIIEPFINPGLFQKFKKKAGGGILLYGPPGCGKTMIAKAIATECKASFLSIGVSDVLNMWKGESERNLAYLFEKARHNKPCVMFFDELDALAYSRSKASSESSRTIVNEFLAQLDGFDHDNNEVLVLAATNMPWDVDSAMKRPGRFTRQIFVPPPDVIARKKILEMKLQDVPNELTNLDSLARVTNNFSGADMDGLIDLAKDNVLAEILHSRQERGLQPQDFTAALETLTPSTIDWLKTARNLVKYAGADSSYKEVEKYLKKHKLN